MKALIYERKNIERIVMLIDCLTVSGIQNYRALAEISDLLDSGTSGEIEKTKEEKENLKFCQDKIEGDNDGMERKEI